MAEDPIARRERRRAAAKARTADLLLVAARRLFDQRGFERTTIRDIAKAAGLSTGSFFNTWPDKLSAHLAAFPEDSKRLRVAEGICAGMASEDDWRFQDSTARAALLAAADSAMSGLSGVNLHAWVA